MSRIRSVHPRLFTDEAFVTASPYARLLMIGLWTEAWDDGVFEWKPLTLKIRLLGADNVNVAELLGELEALNIVMSFEADGKRYGAIRNFCKFQRPKKPTLSGVASEQVSEFVALKPDEFGTSSEPPPTSSEKSPQKGGREEGRKEDNNQQQLESLPRGPEAAAAAVAQGQDDFRMVDHLCRQALGEKAPLSPVIEPMIALIRAGYRIERICDVLRSEAARPRRTPVKTWSLWATVVQEALAAPPPPPPRPEDQPVTSWELPFRQWNAGRGHWPGGKYGPAPLDPACKVPPDVLRAFAGEIDSAREFLAETAAPRARMREVA